MFPAVAVVKFRAMKIEFSEVRNLAKMFLLDVTNDDSWTLLKIIGTSHHHEQNVRSYFHFLKFRI